MDDTIRVHDFGGVDGLRNLCSNCDRIDGFFNHFLGLDVINSLYHYKYFDNLISHFEATGYVPSLDLFGAPYDFRKIMVASYLEEYFAKLKHLVEDAHTMNTDKVTLVAHSIGSLITYIFLVEYCDASWKSKHIKSFISVGAPFGGSSIALKTLLSGIPNMGLLKHKYNQVVGNSTGLLLALPNVMGFDKHDVIVHSTSDKRNFFVHDYFELLEPDTFGIWETHVQPFLPSLIKNTGVPTTLVTSTDMETENSYIYDNIDRKLLLEPSCVLTTKGDKVVPIKSLNMHVINGHHYPNYKLLSIPNCEHTRILESGALYAFIKDDMSTW